MNTRQFHFKEAVLHFGVYPGGKKVLLAFHGFGQSQGHFSSMAAALAKEYTLYSFDLFYHGRSLWPDSRQPISKDFWKEMMEGFLKQEEIEQFSLISFSLGGKFALATFEAFPQKTKELFLIAPDGISTSFWYNMATYPSWARNYFLKVVEEPESLFRLFRLFRKFQLIDKGILRFAEYQMSNRHQREKVYNSWVMSRALRFDMTQIASLINRHKVKVKMYLGRYDRLMTERNMQKLLRHLHDYELEILNKGHYMLIEDVARFIRNNR
ncbi:alpha/beta fold hydrolase [Nafulsella turpanensis]|uniref:alpha/beta fold hydrolase n=1 Tax=Nafulsella turpanensis TaxID=1265690 RepID=UPI00034A21D7|nr:alpha/beta hydrolase [Nafulsella turpanensis]